MANFKVEDIFEIKGKGTVVTGQLLDGEIEVGMTTSINGIQTNIGGIETFRKAWTRLDSGQPEAKSAGILLQNMAKRDIEDFLKANSNLTFSFGDKRPDPLVLQPLQPETKKTSLPWLKFLLISSIGIIIVYYFYFRLLSSYGL